MKTAAAAAVAVAILITAYPGEAHKGITSKFTYNADVHPVFLNRCGRCHVDGGVGPMSLLKYEDAFPWAESLRSELLNASASSERRRDELDSNEFVKAAHRQISARELDVVLDWATGGTPEGDAARAPAPPVLENEWAAGVPDLAISIPQAFEIAADLMEQTHEFVLTVPVSQPQTASRLDVLPGTPAIVRTVTISLRSKTGETRVLGTWFPRQTPVPLALKPAARLEPGAEIIARVHYKKTWKFEGQAMKDQSSVGLYFAD